MNDEIAPEIAELLAQTANSLPSSESRLSKNFDFLESSTKTVDKTVRDTTTVDLSIKNFEKITKFFEDTPSDIFKSQDYYKVSLSGENESSQRLHSVLSKYLTCQDPKDRSVYRQQLITIYWDFVKSLAKKIHQPNFPLPKRYTLRFGTVLPSLLTEEQRSLLSSVIFDNIHGEPVYYMDEWFKDIAQGKISLSTTDEARPTKKQNNANSNEEANRLLQLQTKNTGKLQNAENLLSAKESERRLVESELKSRIDQLCEHAPHYELENHFCVLSEPQKRLFAEINEKLKALQKIDKELNLYLDEYQEAKNIQNSLKQKFDSVGDVDIQVDASELETEIGTVRQMAKMTVGRQGNHYPILTREYFHCIPRGIGIRENVIETLAWIESIDPGAFCRIHRNQSNRIVPYTILLPTYGDIGFCWEPFDRYNRTTSRGRIVVPMYPKNLQIAVITAVADLRWQVAKEKASYYWMEEGLTGQYYQWFSSKKLKGDLKDFFINDYVLWITKESDGVQRLEKEVRAVFWRHIPFTQEIKEKLKTRSLIYQELYQRDVNRSMSDGY